MGKKQEKKNPKRIFAYWVNQSGSSVPPYIQLCMQTWYEHIPDLELVILNHENLFKWIDPYFDMRAFTALSLPMQSDIVEYSVLYQHGGIFLDSDTILTRDIFAEIEKFERNKIYFFGNPEQRWVHIGFIACLKARNKGLLLCVEQEKALLRELIEKGNMEIEWCTFGNRVIDKVIHGDLSDNVRILDRIKEGAILEASYLPGKNTYEDYVNFYFTQTGIPFDDILDKIKFGLVYLHNSWTPNEYKALSHDEILKNDLPISRLLKHALGPNFS